jgi:hypothetical protein
MASLQVQTGIYFIQNAATGTVVDLKDGSNAQGTKIQGYQKRELNDSWVPAQLWVISQVGSSELYTIENTNSRTFLQLDSNANGAPIAGFNANGNTNQQWVITRNSTNTSYVIANRSTGTYFDLYNGGSANLTPVNGWTGSGSATTNPHQLWNIVRV